MQNRTNIALFMTESSACALLNKSCDEFMAKEWTNYLNVRYGLLWQTKTIAVHTSIVNIRSQFCVSSNEINETKRGKENRLKKTEIVIHQ